ncbi:MAG: VOC family protein, partial [Ilumatobacteraceae bacterium]
FYGDLLGWPVTREWPAGDGQGRGRIFGYGDTARVELIEHEQQAPVSGLLLSVQHDDVERLHAMFVAAGTPILRELADQPWGHRNLAVHDPTGLEVVFFQLLG